MPRAGTTACNSCLLYTSDAADDLPCVDLGGRRIVDNKGKLGGQAQVPGVAGTWKDLTDTVNVMAANLTEQVRGIVKVVTAVANGDLKQNLTVKSKGEVAALAETINNMTDTLATFAEQVTSVALSLIHISEPTRLGMISYAVFC